MDVTDVVAIIALATVAVGTIGAAVFGTKVGARAWKWLSGAL